jgi:4-deoxy-L-threo-5-hexosulose-uronate ketol-isomerase
MNHILYFCTRLNKQIAMSLQNRYACSPNEVKTFDTTQLRANFLISDLMVPGEIKGVYSITTG